MNVRLEHVSKTYGAPDDPARIEILHEINLTIERGQALSIVGPSGSGKSTLLNLIGTLDTPSSGTVRLDGRDTATLKPDETADLRGRHIGFIFQLHHLLPHCTVLENILVPTLALRPPTPDQADRARELLELVGLTRRADHYPDQISGGERQRAAVARALMNRPGLVLADEPTGALDRHNAETLFELLSSLQRSQGVTLVVVTHAEDLARRFGRVFTLQDRSLKPLP